MTERLVLLMWIMEWRTYAMYMQSIFVIARVPFDLKGSFLLLDLPLDIEFYSRVFQVGNTLGNQAGT